MKRLLCVARTTMRKLLVVVTGLGICLFFVALQPKNGTGSMMVNGTSKVILMTHGRSGSSFISKIIQRDPDVFYTFEPLYSLSRRFSPSKKGEMKLIYPTSPEKLKQYDVQSRDIVSSFLTCSFESLLAADIGNYQLRNSEDSRLLWSCVKRHSNWTALKAVDCFLQSRRLCLQRRVHMIKTIRLRGNVAVELMDLHPDLKVIYLVRDPRGTIFSQKRVFGAFSWDLVRNFSSMYCQVMAEDLMFVGKMSRRFPRRIQTMRYEQVAERPMKASEELYRFLGLSYTKQVNEFVFNATQAGDGARGAYQTLRDNSTQTAHAWRQYITLTAAQIIDLSCKNVYKQLGYLPVTNVTQLRDTRQNLRHPVSFYGQLLY